MKIKTNKFDIKKVTLSSKNIDDFELLDFTKARKQRTPKIKALMKFLRLGNNFDAPIVICKNGKKVVIDGMHRYEAIRYLILEDNTFEIEVTIFQYPAMTLKEQGALFRNWNSGTPQSTDDYLKMFSSELLMYNSMTRPDFSQNVAPVSIYPIDGEVHFRKWVGSYTAATYRTVGGNAYTNDKFLEVIRKLDNKDYYNFKEMAKNIKINIPSIFERGYRYATTTGVAALVYVYHWTVNVGKITDKEFWTSYHKHVATDELYYDSLGLSGITATREATKLLLLLLNKGQDPTNPLIIPGNL